MRDPYTVLGVSHQASPDEIKTAFRRLARDYHPDRNPNDPQAEERFREINAAYQMLGVTPKNVAGWTQWGQSGGHSTGTPGARGVGGLDDLLGEILEPSIAVRKTGVTCGTSFNSRSGRPRWGVPRR